MPEKDRIVPILNLISLSELHEWTTASYDFIRNANISKIRELIKKTKTNTDNYLHKKIISDLEKLTLNIAFCRGGKLLQTDYDNLKENIKKLKNQSYLPRPFNFLTDDLYNKVEKFNKSDLSQLMLALAEWRFEHNYFQQLITLLQEFTLTLALQKST